jgi:uncharacterized protein (DUF1501 family)
MHRRRFLQSTAAGAALSGSAAGFHAWPSTAHGQRDFAPDSNPVLVVIYLRGGQDQLNTIVPHNDRRYYEIRPAVAVPQEKVVRLDDQWGLHPALAPLKPFYDAGQVAAVINSGSPHATRSHFDAQDFMEFAAPGNRTVRDGWLNRFLTATAPQENRGYGVPELRALAMQEVLPRSLRGQTPVIAAPDNLHQIQEVLDLFEDFYAGSEEVDGAEALRRATQAGRGVEADPVMASGRETIYGLRRLRELLHGEAGGNADRELEGTAVQEYPGGYFSARMEALARVIKAGVGLEVAATDINGWDHHIGMGSDDGALNRMLEFFSETLAAFMSDLGPHLNRTLVLVCTEFGRVCKENGNDGTDHGHGGAIWLLGGRVKGGKIYGNWTGLEEERLYEKRDLPVTTDFRAVFTEVLTRHMQYEVPSGFFPDYALPSQPLGLFG